VVLILVCKSILDFSGYFREIPAQRKSDAPGDIISLFIFGQFVDCRIVAAIRSN